MLPDPLAGLANLFDVSMIFVVALLLAMVSAFHVKDLLDSANLTIVKNAGRPDMELIVKKGQKLERYSLGKNRAGGTGQRLGTCYRLESGEVIYVPREEE